MLNHQGPARDAIIELSVPARKTQTRNSVADQNGEFAFLEDILEVPVGSVLSLRAPDADVMEYKMDAASMQAARKGVLKLFVKCNDEASAVSALTGDFRHWDAKREATVYFKFNSAGLTDSAKRDLDELAQRAGVKNKYVVEIAGFDDVGAITPRTQRIGEERTLAVTRYLEQHGQIPASRIITPMGMETSHETVDNATRSGRKINRRVEVKLLAIPSPDSRSFNLVSVYFGTDRKLEGSPIQVLNEPNTASETQYGIAKLQCKAINLIVHL